MPGDLGCNRVVGGICVDFDSIFFGLVYPPPPIPLPGGNGDGGGQSCPPGFALSSDGQRCEEAKCPEGMVKAPDGSCFTSPLPGGDCPDTMEKNDKGECVFKVTKTETCPDGQLRDANGDCPPSIETDPTKCDPRTEIFVPGIGCVPILPPPPPPPPDPQPCGPLETRDANGNCVPDTTFITDVCIPPKVLNPKTDKCEDPPEIAGEPPDPIDICITNPQLCQPFIPCPEGFMPDGFGGCMPIVGGQPPPPPIDPCLINPELCQKVPCPNPGDVENEFGICVPPGTPPPPPPLPPLPNPPTPRPRIPDLGLAALAAGGFGGDSFKFLNPITVGGQAGPTQFPALQAEPPPIPGELLEFLHALARR